jgi:hypothetical protein
MRKSIALWRGRLPKNPGQRSAERHVRFDLLFTPHPRAPTLDPLLGAT